MHLSSVKQALIDPRMLRQTGAACCYNRGCSSRRTVESSRRGKQQQQEASHFLAATEPLVFYTATIQQSSSCPHHHHAKTTPDFATPAPSSNNTLHAPAKQPPRTNQCPSLACLACCLACLAALLVACTLVGLPTVLCHHGCLHVQSWVAQRVGWLSVCNLCTPVCGCWSSQQQHAGFTHLGVDGLITTALLPSSHVAAVILLALKWCVWWQLVGVKLTEISPGAGQITGLSVSHPNTLLHTWKRWLAVCSASISLRYCLLAPSAPPPAPSPAPRCITEGF